MIHKLSRNRSIAFILVFSFIFSMITPITARAGVLGSVLNFIKPAAGILGNIGGAIAGASLGSAFCPPLGTIAGGIIGYVVGGVIANYAAGGLSNVATLAGAAAGYAALSSMGPIGMVAGVFLGGILGKSAYKLLKKVDNKVTGGLVFAPEESTEANNSTSTSVGQTANVTLNDNIPVADSKNEAQSAITNADVNVQDVTEKYQAAYQRYITAARDGANSTDINKAYKEYVEAYENYKKVTGKK
jgi:hypothetical protein